MNITNTCYHWNSYYMRQQSTDTSDSFDNELHNLPLQSRN